MKLFISGEPGTGKTFTGERMQSLFGWQHFDCESAHRFLSKNCFENFLEYPERHIPLLDKTVITWGFIPIFYPTVVKIVRQDFIPVWLEGKKNFREKLIFLRENDKTFASKLASVSTEESKNLFTPHIRIQAFDETGQPVDNAEKLNTLQIQMNGLDQWGTMLE